MAHEAVDLPMVICMLYDPPAYESKHSPSLEFSLLLALATQWCKQTENLTHNIWSLLNKNIDSD